MTTNTRETFFKHKEHYLAFRAAWAKAVNSEKAKSRTVPCDEWNEDTCDFTKGTGRARVKGWVTGAHVMLYNILRGKAHDVGFTPITNTNKLQNGSHINEGLYQARNMLSRQIRHANRALKSDNPLTKVKQMFGKKTLWVDDTPNQNLVDFLEVFDGTVTPEMVAAIIDLPVVLAMTSGYGPYKKVAEHIIESNKSCKPSTFKDIEDIHKYVTNLTERLRHVF